MASSVPSYLETTIIEGHGLSDETRARGVELELALCQIEAIEAQTAMFERIAERQTAALDRIAEAVEGRSYRKLLSACATALASCQDGDAAAAAHVLHSALGERS